MLWTKMKQKFTPKCEFCPLCYSCHFCIRNKDLVYLNLIETRPRVYFSTQCQIFDLLYFYYSFLNHWRRVTQKYYWNPWYSVKRGQILNFRVLAIILTELITEIVRLTLLLTPLAPEWNVQMNPTISISTIFSDIVK